MASLDFHVAGLDAPVAAFSGGQRQAIAIGRAIFWNARLVIIEEPTAALGVPEQRRVLALIESLRARQGDHLHLARPARHFRGRRQDRGVPPRRESRQPRPIGDHARQDGEVNGRELTSLGSARRPGSSNRFPMQASGAGARRRALVLRTAPGEAEEPGEPERGSVRRRRASPAGLDSIAGTSCGRSDGRPLRALAAGVGGRRLSRFPPTCRFHPRPRCPSGDAGSVRPPVFGRVRLDLATMQLLEEREPAARRTGGGVDRGSLRGSRGFDRRLRRRSQSGAGAGGGRIGPACADLLEVGRPRTCATSASTSISAI